MHPKYLMGQKLASSDQSTDSVQKCREVPKLEKLEFHSSSFLFQPIFLNWSTPHFRSTFGSPPFSRKVKRLSLNIWHKWQVIAIAVVVVIVPVWYRVMNSYWRAKSWVDQEIRRKLPMRIFAGFQNITAVMSPGPPEIWTSLPRQQPRFMLKRARKMAVCRQ